MNKVQNVGTVYRSPTGRGYSSNAELDFHVDGTDLVALTCYNKAKSGGSTMCTSSETAFFTISAERPDLAEVLRHPYAFSRQGEQADDQAPWFSQPVFGIEAGRTFCTWVRNRAAQAAELPGSPGLSDQQLEAVDHLDEVARRDELMLTMELEPGDMQILSNHTMLHSRTEFDDFEDDEQKRLLYRLWLAPPESPRLPAGWDAAYGTTEPGAVRGGIKGQNYDDTCRTFDHEQAAEIGMNVP